MKMNSYSLEESFGYLLRHARAGELAARATHDTFAENLNFMASAVIAAAEVQVRRIRDLGELTNNIELKALLDEKIVSSVL